MLKIKVTKQFEKDLKKVSKRGYDINLLNAVVKLLLEKKQLPKKYKDHELKGNYKNYRECHITPDWLLIYKIEEEILTLVLVRTGTHSDLF